MTYTYYYRIMKTESLIRSAICHGTVNGSTMYVSRLRVSYARVLIPVVFHPLPRRFSSPEIGGASDFVAGGGGGGGGSSSCFDSCSAPPAPRSPTRRSLLER